MNRSKLFLILAILALCFSCTSYHVTDVYSDLTYRVVPATLNLLQKEFPSKDYGTVVSLDCAKGESESAQIVFLQLDKLAGKTNKEYKIVQNPLVSENGEILTETEIGVVGYVHVKKPSIAGFNEINYYPDPILPQNSFTVDYKKSQSVFYTVYIPREAKEGLYTSTLDLYEGEEFAYSIPVTVKVYKTTLPVTPFLKTRFNEHDRYDKDYYDEQLTREDILEQDIYYMERFRINTACKQVSWENVFYRDENGILQANWDILDAQIEERMAYGINFFDVPLDVNYDILEPENEALRKEYEEQLVLINQHLVEKDWTDLFYWYNFDEPTNKKIPKFIEITEWGKKYAPDIKSLTTLGWATPGKFRKLAGIVDVWVPHIDQYETKFFPSRQAQGDRIWIYTCMQTFYTHYPDSWKIDTYGTCHRSLGWWMYKYNIEGYLYWAISCWWHSNPWEDAETFDLANGDGSLLYPPLDGESWPYNSMRLHTQRDGFEDFDFLKMLEEASQKEGIYTQEELAEIQEILSVDDVIPWKGAYTKDDMLMINLHKRMLELLDKSI